MDAGSKRRLKLHGKIFTGVNNLICQCPFDRSDNSVRDDIVKAAQQRFQHYGYTKTNLCEIAADVGMSAGSKDLIKSGGEWISSIELENCAMTHLDIAEAAVIGAKHTKWNERLLTTCYQKTE